LLPLEIEAMPGRLTVIAPRARAVELGLETANANRLGT
jgi:hypothetical protein